MLVRPSAGTRRSPDSARQPRRWTPDAFMARASVCPSSAQTGAEVVGRIRSAKLRERLEAHCGDTKRVTGLWSCGDRILCATDRVVDIFDDVLVVLGFTPTGQERLDVGRGCCEGCNSLEVVTFMNVDRVCAVCNCQDHRQRHGGGDGMD